MGHNDPERYGTTYHGPNYSAGRWPANVAHDGSQAVLDLFPTTEAARKQKSKPVPMASRGGNWGFTRPDRLIEDDGGSAARYFFCAKASRRERDLGLGGELASGAERASRVDGPGRENGRAGTRTPGRNTHPTVKPVALMRWLVRLVTPPGGLVLDPFLGSGTTGIAAHLEGFRFIGCELDPENAAIAELRIRHFAGDDSIESEAPRDEVAKREPRRAGFFC
jgi:site-specific DNA-methyltransferase (adenine-specific)